MFRCKVVIETNPTVFFSSLKQTWSIHHPAIRWHTSLWRRRRHNCNVRKSNAFCIATTVNSQNVIFWISSPFAGTNLASTVEQVGIIFNCVFNLNWNLLNLPYSLLNRYFIDSAIETESPWTEYIRRCSADLCQATARAWDGSDSGRCPHQGSRRKKMADVSDKLSNLNQRPVRNENEKLPQHQHECENGDGQVGGLRPRFHYSSLPKGRFASTG